jgi:pimeloyl-ACP methyl ester carboxylesterase
MESRPETKVIQLDDGRDLAWIEVGDPGGAAVFAFHGSPGLGMDFSIYDDTASQGGVRLIAVDRPGYGRSTYQPRRRLSQWPADISQLADHLRIERFSVIGHSCGGPHALACARFLPKRVLGCGVLSGLAPQAREPMTEGMLASNRIQTTIYRHWPPSLDPIAAGLWQLSRPLVGPALQQGRRHPEKGLDRMQKMLPPCDAAVVSRPELRPAMLAGVTAFTNAVLRTSIQDMAIGIRAWGFDLEDIEVSVQIWHGELDRNIPISHAHRQAETIAGATLHACPGEGHWLLVDHMPEILRKVTADPS